MLDRLYKKICGETPAQTRRRHNGQLTPAEANRAHNDFMDAFGDTVKPHGDPQEWWDKVVAYAKTVPWSSYDVGNTFRFRIERWDGPPADTLPTALAHTKREYRQRIEANQ